MRYFYDLHECGVFFRDEEGAERDSISDARDDALRAARDIMRAEVSEGRLCLSCKIEVKDAAGTVVLTVPFREAITVTGL